MAGKVDQCQHQEEQPERQPDSRVAPGVTLKIRDGVPESEHGGKLAKPRDVRVVPIPRLGPKDERGRRLW